MPTAPYAVLSQNGRLAASVHGARALLLDAGSGAMQVVRLPHQASKVALSPNAEWLTVANAEQISLLGLHDGEAVAANAAVPARPYRLLTAPDGTTAAAFVYNDEESVLGIWRGETLKPVFPPLGFSLGEVLPDFLWLDAKNECVLIWGQHGPGAFGGQGQPYIRVVGYNDPALAVRWNGSGLPFAPTDFLMPLPGNRFAVTRRERMNVYSLDAPGTLVASHEWRELERVVCSPSGVWAAWLWNTSAAGSVTYHLGRARLDGTTAPQVIAFDHLGEFSQFAISDTGELTLLYGIAPNRLQVYRATEGTLSLTGDYDLRAILNTP